MAKLKIKYASVGADHIIRDMVQQNMFQEKQRRSLRAEQQRVRRLENRLDKATEIIKDLKAEVQETKQLLCWRQGHRLSRHGGYCMAWGRQAGHASGKATVSMMAGQEERGKFKSFDCVYRYEIWANMAQRVGVKNCETKSTNTPTYGLS